MKYDQQDAELLRVWEILKPEPGVYTLPVSKQKVVLWYDQDSILHINGMGAVIGEQ